MLTIAMMAIGKRVFVTGTCDGMDDLRIEAPARIGKAIRPNAEPILQCATRACGLLVHAFIAFVR